MYQIRHSLLFSQSILRGHGSPGVIGSLASRMARQQFGFHRVLGALLLVAFSLVTGACSTVQTTKPGFIGIDRDQKMSGLVSSEQMTAGANAAYADVLTKAKRDGQLNAKPKMTQRVQRIAKRIIPHVTVYRDDALNWDWQVNVIDSEQLNAWAMPGGKIAFYSGIIEKLQLTDNEIAAIMGHEIAHALREHSRERASQQAVQGLLIGVVGAAAGVGQGGQALADMVAQMTFGLPNSRAHETESDRMGVELMARAGYDPRASITVWQKMAKQTGGKSSPQWLSTHPSNQTRIADLTDYAARVMPLYKP